MPNIQNVNQQGSNLAQAHTLRGSPVQGSNGVTHAEGSIQPAGLHSTAPYKPPKRRHRDNPDKLLCSFEGCKAYPIKSAPYCAGHARSLGLKEWKHRRTAEQIEADEAEVSDEAD